MNDHTPGPWKINNGGGMTFIEEDVTNISICRVSANNLIANAKLIAAAPDLLEALQEVVRISDRNHDAWDKAKAAIAKAKGERQ